MRKKEITVVIKDENGDLLFTYSEPIELNKRSLENMVWIKKGIWNIKELLNTQPQAGVFTEFTDKNISDDVPKGFVDIDGKLHKFEYNPEKKGEWKEKQRSLVEKAQIEVLTDIFQVCYQEDSKTLELVEEKLSKLTTK